MSLTKVSYSMIQGAPINVLDFGAKGDGVTDDTAAIQAAANVGGTLYFPDGTYEITHVDLGSNTHLVGESWNTVIHQIAGTNARPGSIDGMFTINYTNNQTPTSNVSFRNIQFRMNLPTGVNVTSSFYAYVMSLGSTTLAQWQALFSGLVAIPSLGDVLVATSTGILAGGATVYTQLDADSEIILGGHTENVIIDNCYFYGWRGDAVTLGAQMSGINVPVNYVAQNSSITNCWFDGINNSSRQGISVLSVDGMYINANYFLNTTNAYMPGAIDIEPELPLAYARTITVTNNIFVGVGPSGARRRAVVVDLGGQSVSAVERRGNITVNDNYMNATNGISVFGNKECSDVNFNSNWVFGTTDTMVWLNINGLSVANNYFEACETINIGFTAAGAEVRNASIYGNTFDNCGILSAGLQINTLLNGSISDNQFIDCGGSGDLTAIRFAGGGTQTGITVHDNVFTTPNAITLNALMSSGTQDAESLYHDNIFKDNINPGDWQNGFYLNENGMISSTTVSFAANANTILYNVPPNKKLVLTKAVVIAGADAGATTTISIGQSTSTTDFIPANTLSNLDAADDAVILQPIPNTTPLKSRAYPAGSIISCTVATASGGATNTVQLYGTFI